jgi:uncharacterized protein (DUF952 family)
MGAEQVTARPRIYKIARRDAWDKALRDGQFTGSSDDLRDGYIHLSTSTQVAGTLSKHFAGQRDLVLVEVDADALGALLKWEPSRGGALFPHLYTSLDTRAVISQEPLELGEDGRHRLPRGLVSC